MRNILFMFNKNKRFQIAIILHGLIKIRLQLPNKNIEILYTTRSNDQLKITFIHT